MINLNLGLRFVLQFPHHFSTPTNDFAYGRRRNDNDARLRRPEGQIVFGDAFVLQALDQMFGKVHRLAGTAEGNATGLSLRYILFDINSTIGTSVQIANHFPALKKKTHD